MSPKIAPGRLLVVDDNKVNRLLLGRGLEQQGHTIALAENGRQALEMLHQSQFDLLLLDIQMPEMDGYQVLEKLQCRPELAGYPGDCHLRPGRAGQRGALHRNGR